MTEWATLWQGTANAWECDEMGHMNVRFYAAKVEEALDGLLIDANAKIAPDPTMSVASHHIRYHRESRAGTPLRIVGGALARGAGAALYFEFQAAQDSQPKASFVTTLSSGIVLPPGPCAALPQQGAPRGLVATAPRPVPTMSDADSAGMMEITRTVIRPEQLDARGALMPHQAIGMISDGVAHLMTRITPERGTGDAAVGGAALEQRVFYHAPVSAGDPVSIRSGIVEAGDKTMRIVHWLLNRRTGTAFATSEVIAVTFDLVARRALSLPAAARERIAALAVSASA
jgi:acyl-CoA thioester hydrolase